MADYHRLGCEQKLFSLDLVLYNERNYVISLFNGTATISVPIHLLLMEDRKTRRRILFEIKAKIVLFASREFYLCNWNMLQTFLRGQGG